MAGAIIDVKNGRIIFEVSDECNTPKISCDDLTKLIRRILDFKIIMML